MELVERFLPQYTFVRGPFGGENWSHDGTFRNSYTRFGIYDDLVSAMADHIHELESK